MQVGQGIVAVWDEMRSEGGEVLGWEVCDGRGETWVNEGPGPHMRSVLQSGLTDGGSGGVRRAVHLNFFLAAGVQSSREGGKGWGWWDHHGEVNRGDVGEQ